MNWTAVCTKDGRGEPGSEGRAEGCSRNLGMCVNAAEYQEYVRIDNLATNPLLPRHLMPLSGTMLEKPKGPAGHMLARQSWLCPSWTTRVERPSTICYVEWLSLSYQILDCFFKPCPIMLGHFDVAVVIRDSKYQFHPA